MDVNRLNVAGKLKNGEWNSTYDIAKSTNEREIQRNRNYIYLHTINFISLFFINELVFKSYTNYKCVCIEHCLRVTNELSVNIHFLQQHRLIFFILKGKSDGNLGQWPIKLDNDSSTTRFSHWYWYPRLVAASSETVMWYTVCTPKCRVDGCTMHIFTYSSSFERRKRNLCFWFWEIICH